MKSLRISLAAIAAVLLVSNTAIADPVTVIKLGLGETGQPDVAYISPLFGTVDDGDAATVGDQNTDVDFTGFLIGFPDILTGASFSLDGVVAVGPTGSFGPVILQNTIGGNFSLFDSSNALLLSGDLGLGLISGSSTSSSGAFFNVTSTVFTGGSLLPFVSPSPAGISFAFSAILSQGGVSGLGTDQLGSLKNFVADATGNLDAQEVPEPATLSLLGLGLVGFARRRKVAA